MNELYLGLIVLGAGVLVLAAVGFYALKKAWSETDAAKAELKAAEGALAETRLELTEARTRASRVDELKAERASEEAMRREAERALAEARTQAARVAGLEADLAEARERAGALAVELSGLKEAQRERDESVKAERERLMALSQEMKDRFQTLAGEALDASTKKLLEQAEQNFKAQHEAAQGGVKTLVDPIRERLDHFRQQVEKLERDRIQNAGQIAEQITRLSQGLNDQHKETAKLVNALQRKSTTRGQWGERTVENILELAGLTKGIDYDAQHQTRDAEGAALRPDFVIKLPGGGRFVVDSKVALTAYLDAVEAPDDQARKDALKRHANQVKTHVKQLSKKEYAASVDGAIDFVALFIPGESFYSAAIEEDPGLFDEAIKANVIITTPATLLALAKAVAYGFRQEKLEQNAQKIAAIGAELHDRLGVFAKHMTTMGSGLKTATANYNKAVASFEGRVMVSARRMAELNGQTRALEGPAPVDEAPRLLAAPDDAPKSAAE
ncbi:MAG: DNA recombination protein RmuC [Oceanicaulis sp.]